MAQSNERLVLASLSVTPTALYTVPALKKVTITGFTIVNKGVTQRLVTLEYGNIGGSGGKRILSNYPLEPSETFGLSIGQVIYTTEEITGSQTVGTDVDIIASGVVEDV